MKLSINIVLPRDVIPLFPNRCIYSGQPNPDNSVMVWTHTLGWWTWTIFAIGKLVRVKVPINREYKARFLLQVYGRWLAMAVFAVIAFYVMSPLMRKLGIFQMHIGVVLVCIVLAPYFFWQVFFPRTFDVSAYSGKIIYEFKDRQYAMEFAELNAEHILSVSPDNSYFKR